jgi:hypothetical protein
MCLVNINSVQLQNNTRVGSAQGFIVIRMIKKKKKGGCALGVGGQMRERKCLYYLLTGSIFSLDPGSSRQENIV